MGYEGLSNEYLQYARQEIKKRQNQEEEEEEEEEGNTK